MDVEPILRTTIPDLDSNPCNRYSLSTPPHTHFTTTAAASDCHCDCNSDRRPTTTTYYYELLPVLGQHRAVGRLMVCVRGFLSNNTTPTCLILRLSMLLVSGVSKKHVDFRASLLLLLFSVFLTLKNTIQHNFGNPADKRVWTNSSTHRQAWCF